MATDETNPAIVDNGAQSLHDLVPSSRSDTNGSPAADSEDEAKKEESNTSSTDGQDEGKANTRDGTDGPEPATADDKALYKRQHMSDLQDKALLKNGKDYSGYTHSDQDGDESRLVPLTDLFVSELQPLPDSSSSAADARHRGPGAHAIPGSPAPMLMLGVQNSVSVYQPRASHRTESTADGSSSLHEEEEEDVIHDVEIVPSSSAEVEDEENNPSVLEHSHRQRALDCEGDLENGMAEAGEEVIDAKILPEAGAGPRASAVKTWFLMFAAFLILLCILVLTLVLAVPSSSNDPQLAAGQASGPTSSHHHQGLPPRQDCAVKPPFQEGLPVATVKFLSDPQHPHCFANNWMLNDPNLESYTPERRLQRFHLASFYYSTNGDHWYRNDNWLSYDVSECEWFSQSHNPDIPQYDEHYDICDDQGNFLKLNLASNNLHGTFPLVKNFITTLRTYDISHNHIHGKVPTASSPNLEVFILSHNNFEGPLVGEGGYNSFDVRVVKLDGNQLHGYHAPLYYLLPHLEIVNITGNLFSGAIPTSVGHCKNLTYFGYGHNQFEGRIPSELAALPSLSSIDVGGNEALTGTIPHELCGLKHLKHLDVSDTAVTGTVPEPLCNATRDGGLEFHADCSHLECCV